jgi:hypothetical protein
MSVGTARTDVAAHLEQIIMMNKISIAVLVSCLPWMQCRCNY